MGNLGFLKVCWITMRALARRVSSLYASAYNCKLAVDAAGKLQQAGATGLVFPGQKLIGSGQSVRGLQTWKKSLSTEAAAKLVPTVESENEVNLETLGRCREKIEVDGMMINWDKAGTGEQVVLMLPGIIGEFKTIWIYVNSGEV